MENKKISFFKSLKFRLPVLVFSTILFTAAMILLITIPFINRKITKLSHNYMCDMAFVAGRNLDNEILYVGEEMLTVEVLQVAVGGIKMEEMESSYIYVLDGDGTMLYHPEDEKIGKPVETQEVRDLMNELNNGNRTTTQIFYYDYNGVHRCAAYYQGKNHNFMLVIAADNAEVLRSGHIIITRTIYAGLFSLLLCGLVGIFMAIRTNEPIEKVTGSVRKLSDLDFTSDEVLIKTSDREDEMGVMASSVAHLQRELVKVISHIRMQSRRLYEASTAMEKSVETTNISVAQVEGAVSDIASGATAQAQDTQTATENVFSMGSMVEYTNKQVEELRENSSKVSAAGDEALTILRELSLINSKTKEIVRVIGEQTKSTNLSVQEIMGAVDIITNIAEETNLLSLNASIEAARAGEHGRGFGVVATQIQKLAEQSNMSAGKIAQSVKVLVANSDRTVETMKEVHGIITRQDKDVENTKKAFDKVRYGIDRSLESIDAISDSMSQMDKARATVVDVVQNLSAIAQENAASTEETNASVAEVSAIMSELAENAKKLSHIAEGLDESVRQFNINADSDDSAGKQ